MENLPNKVPLALAADNFARICQAIDEDNLNETIDALFNETRLDLRASVDRRISFLQFLGGSIAAAKAARDSWKQRVEQLEHVEKRVKEKTLEIMQSQNSIQYDGELGRLCVQSNPPALDISIQTHSKSFSNIVDLELPDTVHIDEKYLKVVSLLQLDTAAIKKDLEAGVQLSWAKIRRGAHIRIRQ